VTVIAHLEMRTQGQQWESNAMTEHESAYRERLAALTPERLRDVVRVALSEPEATVVGWNAAPLRGGSGAGALGGESAIFALTGTARVDAADRPWSAVLKVLAPVPSRDDPTHIRYWKREPLLYRSGLLDTLPDGFRAPRCYGCDELADGTVWLWLELIRGDSEPTWPLARWALAARHLGRFNGAYLTKRPLPQAHWLAGGRLRDSVEAHAPLVARIAAAPDNPDVRRWWPKPIVAAILRLWEEQDAFCTVLERLPQTFGHGDAIRRNLISRHRANEQNEPGGPGPQAAADGVGGLEETVAIDWEFAGHWAVGEEVGQTLSVASAFYNVEPAGLPALDDALFAGYRAGLRDTGWRGDTHDERAVRFAYTAHAALRNLFNAVGASVPDDARRAAAALTYGHTWEQLAERRAEVRPFLLDRADEARRLLKTI